VTQDKKLGRLWHVLISLTFIVLGVVLVELSAHIVLEYIKPFGLEVRDEFDLLIYYFLVAPPAGVLVGVISWLTFRHHLESATQS
jgi:hypothetical protein